MHIVAKTKKVMRSVRKLGAAVCAIAIVAATASSAAFAQAASNTTLGGQVQAISTEFSTTAGFAASTAMYGAALLTFIAGVWYLWQSRNPDNRNNGQVAAGLAGLVLTGLFIGGGSWIQKASNTTTGGNAAITSTAGVITFQ